MSAGDYELAISRSGTPTMSYRGRFIHSRFDPSKEARRAAKEVPPTASIIVLAGLGLGYVAQALIDRFPGRKLIIAEADPDLPAIAGRARDLTGIFGNPAVSLMAGGSPGDVQELLRGGPAGGEIFRLEWKAAAAVNPEWYTELGQAVDETARRREVNARTLERFGPLWVRNLAANCGVISRAVSLDPWKDCFSGIPALVLAGGPSLEDILPHLEVLSESHLIITVDTALPAVLASGAKPDIVAAVDPQYWNTRHLDRCREGAGDALVLAESATHPAVFRRLGGRPWLTRTRFPLGTVLEDAAGISGELRAGGSVATAAWDLARHLGCSPMSIAGLDLGFPGGRTHYAGSLSRKLPLVWSDRTNPAEDRFYHALHDAGARPVPAAGGGRILSDGRMDVYAAWFAESALKLPDRLPSVVGGGGRRVDGMGMVSIPELLERPPLGREKAAVLRNIRESAVEEGAEGRLKSTVNLILESLANLESRALDGVRTAAKAMDQLKNGKNPGGAIAELDGIDQDILTGNGRELVSFLIQPLILEITSGAESDGGNPLETSGKLYREMADSAAYHIRQLRQAKTV